MTTPLHRNRHSVHFGKLTPFDRNLQTVDFVLKKYGAKSIDQIASSDLAEAYSELYAIEADLRSG